MNAQELKSILEPLLVDVLGTYKTPKGKIYPAIRVFPPTVPKDWSITGLEVTISESPDSPGTLPLTGEKLKQQWWNVKLVQFDNSRGLVDAISLIENYFPRVVVVTKPQTTETLGQAFISIYDPVFLGASKCY